MTNLDINADTRESNIDMSDVINDNRTKTYAFLNYTIVNPQDPNNNKLKCKLCGTD